MDLAKESVVSRIRDVMSCRRIALARATESLQRDEAVVEDLIRGRVDTHTVGHLVEVLAAVTHAP